MASCFAYTAFQARRPKDIPNAIWINAPAVPFGYYHGWWEGCWMESDLRSNHCRLYGPGLNPAIVYEGRFMPCDGNQPVPMADLKLKPPHDSSDMWVLPGFVVFLENGRILVPIDKANECTNIRERLEKR